MTNNVYKKLDFLFFQNSSEQRFFKKINKAQKKIGFYLNVQR